jgi:valyl-tRNA synthetase
MLDKTFRPAEVETKHYAEWEASDAFAADLASAARPYTIMMPPPNVTGSLHMGHALNSTIQDVLIRYHRMVGRDTLWQPGMDHAGIATQMVVERELAAQGSSRRDLGRAAFVDKVWEWKQESGGTIGRQLRRLGTSPDWPRERFTMDEGLSVAVRTVFVKLHEQGLIYRDKRLVNWDPKLHTAISDLEVQQKEIQGHLWHIRYGIEGEAGACLTVATTRPETMLGDTGIAVHPDDERYKHLVGKSAILPLVGRRLKIVADDYVDPVAGSGALKVTPAHDFNDFEIGRRHDLERINIFDQEACLNDQVPEAYRGLDRYQARKQIVADLEALGVLEKVEDHRHMVPHGDRSQVAVEPWLTDQWYVDAKTLAQPAIEAVEQGRTTFVPAQWANTYYEWMRNIQPWCVSRQLWRGPLRQARGTHPRRGRAGHLVLLRALAVLDPGLARGDAGTGALLSRRRAGHRLRHHLLLGRPHDDDGPALHGRGTVPHGLHPRPGARPAGPEDVKVQGQHHRSPGPDRTLWGRRPAFHPGGHGGARAGREAGGIPGRGLPQLRHQAVECGAVLPDERGGAGT